MPTFACLVPLVVTRFLAQDRPSSPFAFLVTLDISPLLAKVSLSSACVTTSASQERGLIKQV